MLERYKHQNLCSVHSVGSELNLGAGFLHVSGMDQPRKYIFFTISNIDLSCEEVVISFFKEIVENEFSDVGKQTAVSIYRASWTNLNELSPG